MSTDLQTAFDKASGDVTKLSKAPDNLEKLRLYSLFKQASKGDCMGDRPGMLDMVGRAKYDAWKGLAGTTQDEAKQLYIDLVTELQEADK